MFGMIRRRKPVVHAHWYVPLLSFRSDVSLFYDAIGEELAERQVPDATVERIGFRQGGMLSANRAYLRIRRERAVVDVCSAPFGTGWWFSARAAVLPRSLRGWELLLALAGLGSFCLLYAQLYGPYLGAMVLGSSLAFLLLVFLTARSWTGLDEFLLYIPVVGALYERFARPETYFRQDQRLMFADLVNTVVRGKVAEFCRAGGVEEPRFVTVSDPPQVIGITGLLKSGPEDSPKPS